jgi:hypothetical protein
MVLFLCRSEDVHRKAFGRTELHMHTYNANVHMQVNSLAFLLSYLRTYLSYVESLVSVVTRDAIHPPMLHNARIIYKSKLINNYQYSSSNNLRDTLFNNVRSIWTGSSLHTVAKYFPFIHVHAGSRHIRVPGCVLSSIQRTDPTTANGKILPVERKCTKEETRKIV